jgi:colicin import membrane protein
MHSEGVIVSSALAAPVRARPEVPSAMQEVLAAVQPAGSWLAAAAAAEAEAAAAAAEEDEARAAAAEEAL